MIDPNTFIGLPRDFKGKFNIYPPTVKQVLGEPNFGVYLKIFTTSEDDLRDELTKKTEDKSKPIEIPTPFEFLLINCYYYPEIANLTKEAFKFFTHKDANFFYE
jgi:hypothetical protein